MSTEVGEQKYYSSTIERTYEHDSRLGEINVPNAGAIHNPTIERQANKLAEQNGGKRRFRSITGTFWCDNEETRHQQFEHVLQIWNGELKFICYGAIEKTEENKKPHLHFLLMFNGQKQWKTIIKTLDPHLYHIEAANKPNAAYSYCKKEDPNNMLEWGEPPKQGARSDLKKILEECEYKIEKIQDEYTNEFMKYKNGFESVCNVKNRPKRVLERLHLTKNENGEYIRVPENRAITKWFHGPKGTGKSFAVELEIEKLLKEGKISEDKICIVDEIQNDFFIGEIPEETDVLWLDDFRGSDMKYSKLLKLLDGRCVPIKGGQRFIKAKYIFITSSGSPEQNYPNLAQYDGIGQLLRRIYEVVDFTPPEDDEIDL